MLVRKFFQGLSSLSFQPLMSFEVNPEELGGGSGETGTEENFEESQGQPEGGYSSFVQEILKDAPKEHVSIMEPYLKRFDAGSTRRFQDLSNKFKHYEPLGWDEETTQQMAEVYRVLNEEPESLYEALKDLLEVEAQNQSESEGGESDQAIQGFPTEWKSQLDQQQQVLEAMATLFLQEQTAKQEATEDSELDTYLGQLKAEYGDFDEEYVLTKISNGSDGEAAVKSYFKIVQDHVNRANSVTDGLPPVSLSSAGGGALPVGELQKLGQVPSKDIQNLIANVMRQANQE